jgi:hypothetical protein
MEIAALLVLLVGAFIFIGLFGRILEFFIWIFTTGFVLTFTFLWNGIMFFLGLLIVIFLLSMLLSNL